MEFFQNFWFEYIQGSLLQPLVQGNKYSIEFYVARAEYSNILVSRIGAFCSIGSFFNNNSQPLSYSPQVLNSPSNYLGDTSSWVKISGEFIASGGEDHITIGFFSDTTNLDTISATDSVYIDHPLSYYYVDGVSVKEVYDSMICRAGGALTIPNVITPNGDGINEEWQISDPCFNIVTLQIYNRWGLKIFAAENTGVRWDGHTTAGETCTEGTYYYILDYSDDKGNSFKASGPIQLIR